MVKKCWPFIFTDINGREIDKIIRQTIQSIHFTSDNIIPSYYVETNITTSVEWIESFTPIQTEFISLISSPKWSVFYTRSDTDALS